VKPGLCFRFRELFRGIASKPSASGWLIALAVLVPRLLWFSHLEGRLPMPVQDQGFYVRAAISVADGRGLSFSRDMAAAKQGRAREGALYEGWVENPGYAFGLAPVEEPSAVMEPGYPLLLALAFLVYGKTAGAVWTVNLGFSLLGAFAMRRLLSRRSPEAAMAGALFWALYPPYVFFSAYAMTETAHAALLVLSCAMIFEGRESRGKSLSAGLCTGIFFLVRATGLVLLLPAALYLGLRRWRNLLAMGLGFLLAVSPWVGRNWLELGEPVLMPTKGALNMWMRNHPEVLAEEGIAVPADIPVNRPELLVYPSFEEFPGEVQRSRELSRSALEFMAANPRLVLWLSLQRAAHFMSPGGSTLGGAAFLAGLALLVPLLVLGTGGLVRSSGLPETRFLAGVFLVYFLMHALTHGGARYRLPADMVFLAGAAVFLFDRRKSP
jgi:hypothetical protein